MTIHVPTPTRAVEDLWFMETRVRVLVSKADSADGVSVLEQHLPEGFGPPLHVHHEEDEIFYVMEGALRFQVGGETRVLEAGDAFAAPRGVPHAFKVVSPGGARALTVTRGGFEAMVRAASRPAPAPAMPPRGAPTPEQQAMLATICAANGIELLGPPIA